MPPQTTSRKKPSQDAAAAAAAANAAANDDASDAEKSPVPAAAWAHGDHARQVALAGLLVESPELRDAQLTDDEWQAKLDEYLDSERV